ncbi:hypothetical protein FQR65_LT19767 [Abscondita terminalis]|nr:hypothetical protein FQR65_LT19767 [Abscondita terminalis]
MGRTTAPKDWKIHMTSLLKQLIPKAFDARQWAKQAKDMGARYVIFKPTKHHDGFAFGPTKYTDYNITKSPYKKDIVKQVVDAYTLKVLMCICIFLFWNGITLTIWVKNLKRKRRRQDAKVSGLTVPGISPGSKAMILPTILEKEYVKNNPGLIIGSRFRNDEFGKRHFDSNGDMLGDYEQGWERKLPEEYSWLEGRDWDCVMTIPPNGWGI